MTKDKLHKIRLLGDGGGRYFRGAFREGEGEERAVLPFLFSATFELTPATVSNSSSLSSVSCLFSFFFFFFAFFVGVSPGTKQ